MSAKRTDSDELKSTNDEVNGANSSKKRRAQDVATDRNESFSKLSAGHLAAMTQEDADSDSDSDSSSLEDQRLSDAETIRCHGIVYQYRRRKGDECAYTIQDGLLDFDITDVPSEVYHAVVQLRHSSLRYYLVHPSVCTQDPLRLGLGVRREVMTGHIGMAYRESGSPDYRLICRGEKAVFEWEVHSCLLKNASGFFSACLDAAKGYREASQNSFEIVDSHGGPATVDRAVISIYGTKSSRNTDKKLHYLSEPVYWSAGEGDVVADYAFADYYDMPALRSQALQRYLRNLRTIRLGSDQFFKIVELIYSLSADTRSGIVEATLDSIANRHGEVYPGVDAPPKSKLTAQRFHKALQEKGLHGFAKDLDWRFKEHHP